MSDGTGTEEEYVALVIDECFAFRTKPASAAGHKAEDWKEHQVWNGCLKVVTKGDKCAIKLVNADGRLFAVCPVYQPGPPSVEKVIDSGRYFVLRIEDGRGKHAFIGIGFQQRTEAFDFKMALQEHFKDLEREAKAKEAFAPTGPTEDFSLKAGQTIKISMKGVGGKRRTTPAASAAPAPGGALLAPPPAGGGLLAPPTAGGLAAPPAAASGAAARRRRARAAPAAAPAASAMPAFGVPAPAPAAVAAPVVSNDPFATAPAAAPVSAPTSAAVGFGADPFAVAAPAAAPVADPFGTAVTASAAAPAALGDFSFGTGTVASSTDAPQSNDWGF